MKTSHMRGHPIYYNQNQKKWYYSDTDEAIEDEPIPPCVKCGETFEGSFNGDADPCLGELPGVDNACCGHGVREDAYIRFTNGVVVKGFDVIEYTNLHKTNRDERENRKTNC